MKFLLVIAMLSAASPALAQRLGGGGTLNISLTRIVMALLLCLMLAGITVLLLKRSSGKVDIAALRRLFVRLPTQRRIDIIETRRVSQHADVCLFRCDGQEYLVLCAERQLTLLRENQITSAPVAEVA